MPLILYITVPFYKCRNALCYVGENEGNYRIYCSTWGVMQAGAIVGQLVIPTFPISRQLHVSHAASHCGHRNAPTVTIANCF